MRTIALLLSGFLLAFSTAAQKKVIPEELRFLYEYDHDQEIKDFDREHIPLDGAQVKYIPFRKGELYGFVDKDSRKTVIAPRFKQVFAVYPEGAIVANEDEHYGLIGYDGKWKITPSFRNLFKEGNLYHGIISGAIDTTYPERYQSSNLNLLFDEQGKFIMNFYAHRQGDFVLDDSIAWFRFGTQYSVYTRRGKIVKTFDYDAKRHFCGIFNNVLVFADKKEDGGYQYVGKDLNVKNWFSVPYSHQLEMMFRLKDAVYGAMSDDGLNFIDKNGDNYPFQIRSYAVGFGFRHLLPAFYSQEYITIQHDETNKFGLMKHDGDMQLSMKYLFLGQVNKGEVAYINSSKGLIGFMDIDGKMTVPPCLPYENVDGTGRADQPIIFSESLCLSYSRFRLDKKRRTLTEAPHFDDYDRDGKIALSLPDSIVLAAHFSDGLATVVTKGGKLGFIDKKGKLVIPFKYEIAVVGAYPSPQIVIPEFRNGFAYLKALKGYIDKKGNEIFSGKRMQDRYNFSH